MIFFLKIRSNESLENGVNISLSSTGEILDFILFIAYIVLFET